MILVAGDMRNSGTAIAWEALRNGASALDAVEEGVRAVEANAEDHSVGLGGYPNMLGEVELDAGIMDGRTRHSGAVGSLRGFAHPISVARAVMTRLPHVLLVGEGAACFAAAIGAERAMLLTEATRDAWYAWCHRCGLEAGALSQDAEALIKAVWHSEDPQRAGGTTVYLAQDSAGDIAIAASTSGWAWKHPGRLGDTPIAGAGFYADNRFGAAACTGTGELAIRTGLARSTVLHMEMGMSVQDAVREGLRDIADLPKRHGGVTLYAIDTHSDHCVGTTRADRSDAEYYVAVGDSLAPVPRRRSAYL
ncbi:MAG: isoaspartyl peptidase/L-asparaginase [Anaerolineae bacterium]|nr:isoaspartyl peptidase/L-asparaginase [Anaerolineae bacterium]